MMMQVIDSETRRERECRRYGKSRRPSESSLDQALQRWPSVDSAGLAVCLAAAGSAAGSAVAKGKGAMDKDSLGLW